ncbi:hypothetical protein H310_05392 [Aphanomyces invadans]|uniref:Uncharacterized protein n=1 Tax=Aphanomyces invadans TaxID=157072 RepID=A0A024UAQ3_9STRA|nr:hypothetical protein H310_05392 [Aphanomyces invadans]ETW02947.1 hypothetical protein H310_05392 [Aphanomyces invadans]RHY28345.1 hypothetical protein DYB32_006040 [Aphanomyces invadans]|eukprot:XP_008868331.1 hypothetical protein H310_05392 [Aphanomyces invadans]
MTFARTGGAIASPNPYAPLESATDRSASLAGVYSTIPNHFHPVLHIGQRHAKLRWVAAIVAVCGLVCVAVGVLAVVLLQPANNGHKDIVNNLQSTPGLKVTLHFKRASLQPYGHDHATIFVAPRQPLRARVGVTRFLFDAIMTIEASPTQSDVYTLVDTKGYYSQVVNGTTTAVHCIDPSQLPSISQMESSLEQSRIVDAVAGTADMSEKCTGGTLLSLTFAGEAFVFCNSAGNHLQHAVGQDLNISIEYLSDPSQLPDIQVPTPPNAAALDCAPTSLAMPTDDAANTPRSPLLRAMELVFGDDRVVTMSKPSCECKGPKKPCLFVHGLGESNAGPATVSFPSYWGDVSSPCCLSTTFVHFDTTTQGWNDLSLQKQFCNAAAAASKTALPNAIGSLILVTHSMGNMLASGALASKVCSFSTSVTWVSLASPQQGSQAANLLQQKCAGGGWTSWMLAPLTWIGYCPPARAYYSVQHESTVNADKQAEFAAAQRARQQFATHVACGVSGWGLHSNYSVPLAIVDEWANHSSDSDGLVDYNSCTVGLNKDDFGGTSSKHYVGPLNHADLTFRTGDGWWGDNRKPLKWFQCLL